MKTIRVIAILSVVAGAACVSSVEQRDAAGPDSTAQGAHESITALHATIPADRASADVFEYSAVLAVPAQATVAFTAQHDGQVFEYN